MLNPYVGITDFTRFIQVESMLSVFNQYKPRGSKRMLHVGVMMSYKTLNGMDSKWSRVFPAKEAVANIFDSDDVLNCLHYADYEHSTGFGSDLARAIDYGGIGIHALQLDMVWPDAGEIAKAIHISRKKVEVILQVGSAALDRINNGPEALIRKLEEYDGVIDRILLDKSMGRGITLEAPVLLPFLRAIQKHFPKLSIGVAGGLGPETLDRILPLLFEFPHLSIDAQSRLRPSGNAIEPIDWDMARYYLVNALALLP